MNLNWNEIHYWKIKPIKFEEFIIEAKIKIENGEMHWIVLATIDNEYNDINNINYIPGMIYDTKIKKDVTNIFNAKNEIEEEIEYFKNNKKFK